MGQVLSSKPKFFLSPKPRVGVFCGGLSSEKVISKRSGKAVTMALKRAGFRVTVLDPAHPKIMKRKLSLIDVAFLTLHGAGGEDGVIQKFLDQKKMPYVGSGVVSSRLAFDKVTAKKIFLSHCIPTSRFIVLRSRDTKWKEKLLKFGVPCFVKPPREGSSIGAMKIEHWDELSIQRVWQNLQKYKELLVEPLLEGGEYTVGILGDKALPVVELRPKATFYDFKAKYTSGMTDYIIPAKIPDAFAKRLQKIALQAHKVLNLRDLSRIDIKVDAQGNPFVLEANSIPGFTEFSLLPKAAKAAGFSFEELCSQLVAFAINRKVKRKEYGKEKSAK